MRFQAVLRGIEYRDTRAIPLNIELPCRIENVHGPHLHELLHRAYLDRWNDEWATAEVGEVTRRFLPSVVDRQEMKWLFPDMSQLFLLTGHGSLNSYLFRIGQSPTASCRCGEGNETSLHVLLHCRLYDHLRPWDPGISEDMVHLLIQEQRYEEFSNFSREIFRCRTEALDDN